MTGSLSMIMIDQTVVSVALPTMQHDLSLSTSGVQWVVNAYLLLLAVFVALGGRIADLLGAELTFRAGAGLFVLSSALCGLATGELDIIAAHGLQGIGAAGGVIGIAILGAIVSLVSAVAPDATVAARVSAATDGVTAAYWTGAGVMTAMALVASFGVRRRG